MQHAVEQHFERKKKQKIVSFLSQADPSSKVEDLQKMSLADLEKRLIEEQKQELSAYLKRTKVEYLQKILDQVHLQNIEFYTNLASEYAI